MPYDLSHAQEGGVELTDFFSVLGPDDIRIRDTRVGIQSVLYEYIYRSRTAEEIAERYPSLRLEHVYAAILYYLLERERLEAYMARWLEREERAVTAQTQDPAAQAFQERLRREHARRSAQVPAGSSQADAG
jgi:uncharacterized protein (DUF433 family)